MWCDHRRVNGVRFIGAIECLDLPVRTQGGQASSSPLSVLESNRGADLHRPEPVRFYPGGGFKYLEHMGKGQLVGAKAAARVRHTKEKRLA